MLAGPYARSCPDQGPACVNHGIPTGVWTMLGQQLMFAGAEIIGATAPAGGGFRRSGKDAPPTSCRRLKGDLRGGQRASWRLGLMARASRPTGGLPPRGHFGA